MISEKGLIEFQFRGETVRINTYLVRNVTIRYGKRRGSWAWYRRAQKMWRNKEPELSKWWTPCKLQTDGWCYDEWEGPRVSIRDQEGDIYHAFHCKSNAEADIVHAELQELLYKIVKDNT